MLYMDIYPSTKGTVHTMARNSILDLYYGNLDPQTMVSKATPELEQFRQQLLTYEKELLNNLSENDKTAFMNYAKTWTQYQALACEARPLRQLPLFRHPLQRHTCFRHRQESCAWSHHCSCSFLRNL